MAIGDDAKNAGYPLVPNTGDQGLIRYGSREINRTRDFIANVKSLLPIGKTGYRASSGISYGSGDPTGGETGDVYFKLLD